MSDVMSIIYNCMSKIFKILLSMELYPGISILVILITFLLLIMFISFINNLKK